MSKDDWGNLVLSIFMITATIALIIIGVAAVNQLLEPKECVDSRFVCRTYHVQKCIESELYTREECIQLVGGGSAK